MIIIIIIRIVCVVWLRGDATILKLKRVTDIAWETSESGFQVRGG
jgi:hypothetical protein